MSRLFGLSIFLVLIMALLFPLPFQSSQYVAAQQEGTILSSIAFDVSTAEAAPYPGAVFRFWGWAARTAGGWTGLMQDFVSGPATVDLPGAAAGLTMTVPKGTSATINPFTTPAGVRASTVCLVEVFDVAVRGSTFTLKGRLQQAENMAIFKAGDIWTLTGSWVTGQAALAAIAGGKTLTFNLKGNILRGGI
jgi:hypothetical protein